MKKTLIALAVLTVSGAAFAQSSVTIYGRVDAGYGQLKTTSTAGVATTAKGIHSQQSTSRLGFMGTEDLGGGLKANFTLEYQIEPDNGSGIVGGTTTMLANSARPAFVGLSGGFGALNVGTQATLLAVANGASDFHGGTNVVGYLSSNNQSSRRANTIQYTSPNLSGFTANVQTSFAGALDTNKGNTTSLSATYAQGPLMVIAAHEISKLSDLKIALPGSSAQVDFGSRSGVATALSNALADMKRTAFGATYNLGVAKVGFTNTKGEAGTTADTGFYKVTSVGVSVPMGATTLAATMDNGKFKDGAAAEQKISGYQLSASYAISKRTNLYAIAGEGKIKSTTGKDSQYAVGLRHAF